MNSEFVEVARFRTRPGVTDQTFLEAEHAVRAGLLKTFPGFRSRELLQTTQGEWMVVLRFDDRPGLEALLARLKADPDASFRAYGDLIDHETMRLDFGWRRL